MAAKVCVSPGPTNDVAVMRAARYRTDGRPGVDAAQTAAFIDR